MLEQLLPMTAALSSLSLPGMPFTVDAPFGAAGPMFVPSQRAQPICLPPASPDPADR